ncbi:MAG: 16S rRNA (guanine(966)-N(2))-methyltransferase RsmD [Ruminococcus sp.]|nr:16S rRNA (guanine(966)-N(2))-methyltransferase RsmD [Ruminococcus sp.]
MRIITGSARGRKLKTLEGLDVRPTTDKVKEAIYSAIQFDVEGATVLDLFSGSGQMGIEAISRGANLVFFVDKSKASIDCTRENIQSVGFSKQAKIFNMDSLDFIKTTSQKFDIVILDPPYSKDLLSPILHILKDKLNNGAKVVCEHEKYLQLPQSIGDLKLKKKYSYGKTEVTLYTYGLEEIL